jgi:hypothetical protein
VELRDAARARPVAVGAGTVAGLHGHGAGPGGAADLVERLEAACRVGRDVFGRAVAADADGYAHAWLAGAIYLTAAARAAEMDAWAGG